MTNKDHNHTTTSVLTVENQRTTQGWGSVRYSAVNAEAIFKNSLIKVPPNIQ